ncbi:MAG: sorbosone dehydrogenase family protein [Rhodospirillaceae bacterium]|nr:sorbosone dehydrogenase family protein [Rhodospirillaceae bacterium]
MIRRSCLIAFAVLLLAACEDPAKVPDEASTGPNPAIPKPQSALIPTVNIAAAEGWPADGAPIPADGLAVKAFARNLDHPRWIHVLPNGDVLVAETNAPPRPDDRKGIKGWIMGLVMKRAGAGTPSANRISLLRDADGDGVAETRHVFLKNLNSPFGMALVGDTFYVANTDAVMKYPYAAGATEIPQAGERLAELPGGPLNHHWTKSLVASPDGKKLYVGSGSNSNAAENGIDKEERRAAVLEIDIATGASRIFASGLRNPVGLAFEPESKMLWAVVNERDELGSDLVPDYLTSVRDGVFYGWPWAYWGQHVDERVKPPRPDMVAKSVAPDYALGNHVAPLGLAFAEGRTLPERFRTGAIVGEHGSWNRKPRSGYKVVFVPFSGGKPNGQPVDVLTGFVVDDKALGRPVGVAIDAKGALLVADDVGNVIWRVTPATQTATKP